MSPANDDGLRPAPGATGYCVDTEGNVYFRRGATLRVRKTHADRDGYLSFTAKGESGVKRCFYVHRLVALAFLGAPPFERAEVRHLDGDPANNRVHNLAWGTHAENMADRTRHGRNPSGARNGRARITEDQAREIKRRLAVGETYRQIANDTGATFDSVREIARGRNWRHLDVA